MVSTSKTKLPASQSNNKFLGIRTRPGDETKIAKDLWYFTKVLANRYDSIRSDYKVVLSNAIKLCIDCRAAYSESYSNNHPNEKLIILKESRLLTRKLEYYIDLLKYRNLISNKKYANLCKYLGSIQLGLDKFITKLESKLSESKVQLGS